MLKNLPAIQETWVRSLGWEEPLEKGMATHSSSGLENFMDCIVLGVPKCWTQLTLSDKAQQQSKVTEYKVIIKNQLYFYMVAVHNWKI